MVNILLQIWNVLTFLIWNDLTEILFSVVLNERTSKMVLKESICNPPKSHKNKNMRMRILSRYKIGQCSENNKIKSWGLLILEGGILHVYIELYINKDYIVKSNSVTFLQITKIFLAHPKSVKAWLWRTPNVCIISNFE